MPKTSALLAAAVATAVATAPAAEAAALAGRKLSAKRARAQPTFECSPDERAECIRDTEARPPPSGTGWIAVALGHGYVQFSVLQARMLRLVGDPYPFSIITHPEAEELQYARAAGAGYLDQVIPYRPWCYDDGMNALVKTPFEQYGLVAKVRVLMLTPYDEFMLPDSEVLPSYTVWRVWEAFRKANQDFNDFGTRNRAKHRHAHNEWVCHFHWNHVCQISDKLLNKSIIQRGMYQTHSGVWYFNHANSSSALYEHFRLMADGYLHYLDLGFLPGFRGGPTDEILLAYAYAARNTTEDWGPIEFPPLFSFNTAGPSMDKHSKKDGGLYHIFRGRSRDDVMSRILNETVKSANYKNTSMPSKEWSPCRKVCYGLAPRRKVGDSVYITLGPAYTNSSNGTVV